MLLWILNWSRPKMKRLWPISRHYPECVRRNLREAMNNLNRDSWYADRDSTPILRFSSWRPKFNLISEHILTEAMQSFMAFYLTSRLADWLTDYKSMTHGLPSEVDRYSADSRKIILFYGIRTSITAFIKSRHLGCILSQINPVHLPKLISEKSILLPYFH
jgi:hypothetical protein